MRGPRGQQLQGPGIARSFITTRRSFITRLQNERRFAFLSRFQCTATVTDAAARIRALVRERKCRQREEETPATRYKHNPDSSAITRIFTYK